MVDSMDIRNISYGPWDIIFQGKWSNHDIELYENPDKDILSIIKVDKANILSYSKYYVVKGEAKPLSEQILGYTTIISKRHPTEKGDFLCVSSGPKYIEGDEKVINRHIEDIVNDLRKKEEQMNNLSAKYSVEIIPIRNNPNMALCFFPTQLL